MDAVRWVTCDGEVLAGIPEDRQLMLKPGKLRLIDQTKLPMSRHYIQTDDIGEVHDAISRLVVRGAPAIGCAAALGLAAAAAHIGSKDPEDFIREIRSMAEFLASSRPTAVNLEWALNRCVRGIEKDTPPNTQAIKTSLLEEALGILEEDIRMCRDIGRHGLALLKNGFTVLTHCNAGALATA
ncbi:MAG: hypothetical protein JW808_02260, partial [Victivallales bacterium]|nr:hypothetical protein [Victivallales bacterium]